MLQTKITHQSKESAHEIERLEQDEERYMHSRKNTINWEYLVSVFWYQVYQAWLPEPMLTSQGLLSDSTCVFEAELGKLDIKRCEHGILFISLPVDSLFKLVIMKSLSSFVLIQCQWKCHSKSETSWWPDKATCREIGNVYQVNVQQCMRS